MIQRIREKGHVLREMGVDPERVIEHIEREGLVPLRSYVDAGDFHGRNDFCQVTSVRC